MYEGFDPYVQYGDYVKISNEDHVQEAKNLCEEQVKCIVPKDFEKYIVISVFRHGPSPHDPLAQNVHVTWKYTPPKGMEMEIILEAARLRAQKTKFPWYRDSYKTKTKSKPIKFRRYNQFKAFPGDEDELKDYETT